MMKCGAWILSSAPRLASAPSRFASLHASCVRAHRAAMARRIHCAPPYRTDEKALFIAYYASAEFGCHLALNWPMPANVLDLFAEFRNATNGLTVPAGRGLLGALIYFGLEPYRCNGEGSRPRIGHPRRPMGRRRAAADSGLLRK